MATTIVDLWADDLLGRKYEAEYIKSFLLNRISERADSNQQKSYVLNLDGEWGQGKTFFLNHFHNQLQQEKYLSVYVNAWQDDHADDPMIAVMSAIDKSLKGLLKKRPALIKLWDTTKRSGVKIALTAGAYGAKKLATKLIGEGTDEIAKIIKEEIPSEHLQSAPDAKLVSEKAAEFVEKLIDQRAEKALKEFDDSKITIEKFKANLSKFVEQFDQTTEFNGPLFVLIDELDRCRPPYAISTLERIKHFFDVKGVAFIIATDSSQLKHSIKAVYGSDFDSNRYLLRFFDRTYRFLPPENILFVNYLFETKNISEHKIRSEVVPANMLFYRYSDGFKLSLRDIEQCYDHLRTLSTIWSHKLPIPLIYIIPLIMLFQQGKIVEYNELCRGRLHEAVRIQLSTVEPLETKRRMSSYQNSPSLEETRIADVLQQFLSFALDEFRNTLNISASFTWQQVLQQYFGLEFERVHGSLSDKYSNKSDVLTFHMAVESAGQFVSPAETNES